MSPTTAEVLARLRRTRPDTWDRVVERMCIILAEPDLTDDEDQAARLAALWEAGLVWK